MERKLSAILAMDVVGYSRLMAADETGTHTRLKALRKEFLEPTVAAHHGRVVKLTGDGALAEFGSAIEAAECAVAMQRGVAERQAAEPVERQITFRIGLNLGDIILDDGDIYGDGVNVAARLEKLAGPGGVCIARNVHSQVKNKVAVGFEPMGAHRVKNIPEPIEVYRIAAPGTLGTGLRRASGRPWRRVALVLAAVVILAAGGAAVWLQPWRSGQPPAQSEAPPVPDKPSIAVLPFQNLSDDPEDAYFADGLTDDLITDLSKIHGLFIIARNTVFTYRDRAVDVPDIARELGVRYVLEGSVRRAGEHVRINAQLIDGSTGGHVWAERYDREYSDIFAVQDMVIAEIVDALSVQLTQSEQTQVMRLPTDSLEAYDYYLRAEQELHTPAGDAGLFRALELYEEAIKLDERFADAYAGFARAAAYLWVNSHDAYLAGALARERVYATAGRALTLNPELPRAHAVLAEAQAVSGEHEAATASARRAADLGPSDAEAHATLAWVLAYAGESAAAVQAAQTALRLDPKPPATVLLTAGLAFFLDHRYEPAIQALEQAYELAPGLNEAPEFLAMAYAQAGRLKEAAVHSKALMQDFPSANIRYYQIVYAHHRRPEDLAHRLDGLRKAGIPEWPFGYADRPEHRMDGARVRALTFGHTWQGRHHDGEDFFLQIQTDGTATYSSPSSLRTGWLRMRDGMLCYRSRDFMLARENCGYVYRNEKAVGDTTYKYMYLNAFSAMHFSLAQ